MPNKNYQRGRRFEYEIADLLREAGYEVIRAAGSHGQWDLVAVKRTGRTVREIGLLQLKIGSREVLTPLLDPIPIPKPIVVPEPNVCEIRDSPPFDPKL